MATDNKVDETGSTPVPVPTPAPVGKAQDTAPSISNAELKKRAKAEKQAKRAARKVENPGGQPQKEGAIKQSQSKSNSATPAGPQSKILPHQQKTKPQNRPQASSVGSTIDSLSATGLKAAAKLDSASSSNRVFKHFVVQRRHALEAAHKDVHPAVLAYGLQTSSYQLCGSTARCVGMLSVFKEVIRGYSIPPDNALARHFIPHVLSPQIEFIKSCRPLAVGMGIAIRHIKDAIVKVDPETSENEAKAYLYSVIDNFIRERITAADYVIADEVCKKIVSGDVIVTFAKSSVVARTFQLAVTLQKKFKVVVVDSKPLHEGKRFAESLSQLGIQVEYYMVSGVQHAMAMATKVVIGAHAMLSDGRLHSRIGTASVAQAAYERQVPVIVLCESYKFSEKIYVDSFGGNELAPPEELLGSGLEREAWALKMNQTPLLQTISLMYDLTPAEYVSMVVTELGPLPPSSVPAVLRMLEARGGG